MAREDGNRKSASKNSDIPAGEAARQAMAQLKELTGRETLAVASLEPVDVGWRVGVEVLEDSRVPSSGDILALYEAEIGLDGELLSYRRARRYRRGDVGDAAGDV
jgi:gas vesicle protein GvpO